MGFRARVRRQLLQHCLIAFLFGQTAMQNVLLKVVQRPAKVTDGFQRPVALE